MSDSWTTRWNERFSKNEYAYGKEPNVFLKEQLRGLSPGRILFPAEGEGRNAVFAAAEGWNVSAFDISEEGRRKAIRLAEERGVEIDYHVGHISDLKYGKGEFDAIALIYAHFPADIKSSIHKQLSALLRKGGTVIFEAFSKRHILYNSKNPGVGGPTDLAMLFSLEEISADFSGYEVLVLQETEVELNEGLYHKGTGSVIRFVGRKNN